MSSRFTHLLPAILLVYSCAQEGASPLTGETTEGDRYLAFAGAAGRLPRTTSVVIARESDVLLEQYFHGSDASSLQEVKSVTKSVVALLVGIAVDRGIIGSVDETIGEYLSTVVDSVPPDKAAITIRHLLTMTGGFSWEELVDVGGYTSWWNAPDQVAYLLATPLVTTPGTAFTYNSAALHLLSVVLTEATGNSTAAFAQTYLFTPLDITSYSWQVDHQGYTNGGSGLRLTPRDVVKIGQLVLAGGTYRGRRIVSSRWIQESTVAHITASQVIPHGSGYGYGLWIADHTLHGAPFGMGWGGQFVLVFSPERLVVSITSTTVGVTTAEANAQWTGVMNVLVSDLAPLLGGG